MARLIKSILCTTVLALLLGRAEASPLLIGQTIQTTYLYPNLNTVYTTPVNSVVGAGLELTNFAALASIDFSDTNILITLNRNGGPNAVTFDGFRFVDINGSIPAFFSVVLNPATTFSGMNASAITFDGNQIFVNLANLQGFRGQVISLDINGPTGAVPEPSELFMVATGVVGLLVFRARMKPGKTGVPIIN